jgi:hypothetical protein
VSCADFIDFSKNDFVFRKSVYRHNGFSPFTQFASTSASSSIVQPKNLVYESDTNSMVKKVKLFSFSTTAMAAVFQPLIVMRVSDGQKKKFF